jgi:UDP-glucose 4-epimerase
MRTLVTGGAGFIGSNLVDRLIEQGHEVTVVDNLSSGNLKNLANASGHARFVEADVTEPDMPEVVAKARPEVLYHLAGQSAVRHSVIDPLFDAHVNLLGTIQVSTSALQAGCQRLVFASSGGTVYGEPNPVDLPIDETYPRRTTSPYGVAIRNAEEYLDSYVKEGLQPVSLRLSNVYGPRQDPHSGAGVVAIFCDRLLSGQPVVIFGDGRQTRDFLFIDDAVDAFIGAGESDIPAGTKLNIGTGIETSVLELYETLRSLAQIVSQPAFAAPLAGEVQAMALDCTLAERTLSWQPRFDLKAGLERTWAWALQNLDAKDFGR